MKTLAIAYEYETAYGKTCRKVVLCDTVEEYRRVKSKIEECNLKVIEFIQVVSSKNIPR